MAENLGSVNISIEPDIRGFKRQLERETDRIELELGISFSRSEIQRSLDAIEKTLEDVDVGLDIDRKEFQRDLAATIKAAEAAVEDIDVGLEVPAGERKTFGAQVQGVVAAVQAATRDIRVGVDVSKAEAALAGLSGSAARAGASLVRLGAIGGGIGGAIAVGGVAVGVNSLREFDAALTQSLAIVQDVTPEIREQFKTTAEEVAQTTVFSTDEAAEAYFFLASAGLDAQQQLAALPSVAKFAQAGMFDLAQATDIVTDAQSALGLATDDVAQNLTNLNRVQDVLVKANLLANASVEQFGTSLTNKVAAQARGLGKDIEEVVAGLAALADQGTKGKIAGERLNIIFRDLSRFGLENKEAFDELGIAVFDANDEFRNIADVIADFETALAGMSDAQRQAAIGSLGLSAEVGDGIVQLLGASGAIREYEAALRDAGGTAEEVAQAQLGSLDAQLSLIGSNIDLVLQSLGQPLADRLKVFFDEGAGGFQDFFAAARERAEAFGAVILGVFESTLAFVQSADFSRFLGSLRAGFETILEGIREFGAEFSSAFGRGSDEGQSFIVSLGQAFQGFAGIIADVLPIIGRVTGEVANFVAENREFVGSIAKVLAVLALFAPVLKVVKFIGAIIRPLLPVFRTIGFFVSDIFITLGRWIPFLARIGFFLGRFATPVGIVSTILFELIRRSETFRNILKSIGKVIIDFVLAPLKLAKKVGIDPIIWALEKLDVDIGGITDSVKDFGLSLIGMGDDAEKATSRASTGLDLIADGARQAAGIIATEVPAAFQGVADAANGFIGDVQKSLADANVREAIDANISDAQVEALQRNKRLAEASAADINAAFKRIGAVAVSDGFRLSLQRKIDGLLNQIRFLRERGNIQFQQLGKVNTGQLFADSMAAGIQRVTDGTVTFVEGMLQLFRTLRVGIGLEANAAMASLIGILRSGFRRARGLAGAGLRAIEDVMKGFVPVFRQAGENVIEGFLDGMMDYWTITEAWLSERADRIRELKGPLPYDRTILFDAGRAVIGGFQSGLESAWGPVESWLSSRGHLMKGIVPVSDVLSLSSEILLGNVANPAEALTDLEPDLPRFWTSFSDMIAQAREIARLFNVQITSTFRDIATNIAVGGAPGSLHTQGRAVDFAGNQAAMDALAAWAEGFQQFFQEILWRVAGHFDHVHLGWALAKAFPRREKGGPTRKGQTYLVGERGPELWTAPARGHVYTHRETAAIQAGAGAGGYNPTYHVHANGLSEAAVLALISMKERKAKQRVRI